MMTVDEVEDLRLIDLFRQKAADRRRELTMIANERFDEDRKRRHELKLRKEEEERKLEAALATPAEIAAFDEHLDQYDTATVQALMDNQHALDLVYQRQAEMNASAYRLPDGRMAFKTEDGSRVLDQHGAELSRDTVHPEAIPDGAPTWEAKQRIEAETEKLQQERDDLHRYQHRLDQVRDAGGKEGMTAEALARMDADLQRDMPDAVKSQLAGVKPDVARVEGYGPSAIEPERPSARYPLSAAPAP